MNHAMTGQPVEILLVEDSPGAVRLTMEALKETDLANRLTVVPDGDAALDYLYRRGKYAGVVRPDLILLDLNLPRRSGREVLDVIKHDSVLRAIPVVVLSTSRSELDVLRCYNLHANCYVVKPVEYGEYIGVIKGLQRFWLDVATLPLH